jgi:hypothetical protein
MQNVWHEAADYSADQIQFQTGTIIGKSASDKNNCKQRSCTNRIETLLTSYLNA